MVLTLLYALGKYTPVFHLIYDFVPGVTLYRRPADATFVFCAMLAIVAGYLVHRFLTGTMPAPRRWQRAADCRLPSRWSGSRSVSRSGSACCKAPRCRSCWGIGFRGGDRRAGAGAPACGARRACRRGACSRSSCVADLGWNNAPNESTGLKPSQYEALRPDTTDETVTLLKAKLKAAAAPDRRDRVELIGVAYHWPNIGLIHDFDHLFGHNPLRLMDFERATAAPDTVAGADQRQFPPLMSSYRSTLEDLFGVRFIAIGVPIEQIDKSLKPGDLDFIARTKDAYVYENPRALPRVHAGDGMAQGRFRRDDPRRRLAGRRSAPHGAAGAARRPMRRTGAPTAPRGSSAIATPRSRSRPMRRAAASSCSTTSGIRGGGRASTASPRKF